MTNAEHHDNFKSDFGFAGPVRGPVCSIPAFADVRLHRITLIKDQHIGSPNDAYPHGMPGWTSKYICAGCGKSFKIRGFKGMFHPDGVPQNQ